MKLSHFTKIVGLFVLLITSFNLFSQKTISSPRDSVQGKAAGASISINYGSPSVKGRTVWGKLVPYGQVWRAGANEATRFKTDKDLIIEGQKLPAGEYSFFAIPGEKKWTVIFNKVSRQWGAFEYSSKEDALRVDVEPHKTEKQNERLKYEVAKDNVALLWDTLEVPLHVEPVK